MVDSSATLTLDLGLQIASTQVGTAVVPTGTSLALDFKLAAANPSVIGAINSSSSSSLSFTMTAQPTVTSGGTTTVSSSASLTLAMDLTAGAPAVNSLPATPSAPAATSSGSGAATDSTGVEVALTGTFELALVPVVSDAFGVLGINPRVSPRAMLGRSVTVTSPVILYGQPYSPRWVVKPDSTMRLTPQAGSTAGGTPTSPDAASRAPSIGKGTYRWLASSLTVSGNFLDTWPAVSGGPSWNSVYPYRPKVNSHEQYGAGAKRFTYSNMVFFNPNFVEHMWLDLGANKAQPFTWIFAGIILSYPRANYGHFLLDAGKPTPVFAPGTDHDINDGLGYRSTMMYDRKSGIVNANPRLEDGKYVRTKHDYSPRPRVFAGVFNGHASYVAAMDNHSQQITRGGITVASHRYFVTGRAQNKVSDEMACHMGLFEIRYFDTAMTTAQLLEQYRQLAASYKFNLY